MTTEKTATPKLGVCMIVRDATDTIDALLRSILHPRRGEFDTGPACDEYVFVDTGSVDDTRARIAAAFGLEEQQAWPVLPGAPHARGVTLQPSPAHPPVHVVFARFEWIDDFAAARNFSFSLSTATWRMYLDADDTVERAYNLRPVVEQTEKQSPQTNVIDLVYRYAPELDQDKMRIVRWDDTWTWEKAIHERQERKSGPRVHTSSALRNPNAPRVVHTFDDGHTLKSLDRNIRIVTRLYEAAKTDEDRAEWAYYLGLYTLATAKLSGDEKKLIPEGLAHLRAAGFVMHSNLASLALCEAAKIYIEQENWNEAIDVAGQASARCPEEPFPVLLLGVAQARRGDPAKACATFSRYLAMPPVKFQTAQDRVWECGLGLAIAADAFATLDAFDPAEACLQRIPQDVADMAAVRPAVYAAVEKIRKRQGLALLKAYVEQMMVFEEGDKARAVLEHVPAEIEEMPEVGVLRRKVDRGTRHLRDWDEYVKVYSDESLPIDFQHVVDAKVGRHRKMKEWAESLPRDGGPVRVLTIGPHDAQIERAMLAGCARIEVTAVEIDESDNANSALGKLAADFPGRVFRHVIRDNWYDWSDGGTVYDVVCLFEVIEHLPDDMAALDKIWGLLAEEGTLFLSTPLAVFWNNPETIKMERGYWPHVRAYSEARLWRLLRRAGYNGRLETTDHGSLFFAEVRKQIEALDAPNRHRVSIYVPGTPLPFDAESHLRGHLGGSEEAVIHLSTHLAMLDYEVTVYAPKAALSDGRLVAKDGVLYCDVSEFDPGADHETVLFWRCPQALLHPAVKEADYRKLLWLHDTSYNAKPEAYRAADGVIVLSQTHADEIKKGDGFKGPFLMGANGIDLDAFPMEVPGKNPRQVIYASSPDRGLEPLLDAWPLIRKEVPDALLDIFYSWEMFEKAEPEASARLRAKVMALADHGVTLQGGVSHPLLHDAFKHAGVWAYPVPEFVEISCITAMKAQAAGCWPVVSTRGALRETVINGFWVPAEKLGTPAGSQELADAVVDAILHVTPAMRERLIAEARTRFDWAAVAEAFDRFIQGVEVAKEAAAEAQD